MGDFFLSREVLDDLDLIWSHIACDNPEAADRVLEAVYRICKITAAHPEIGRLRRFSKPELEGIRSFAVTDFPNYIIFYRVISGDVQVVRVLHGKRDIKGIFERS